MLRKTVFGIILILLLIGVFASTFNFQPVKAVTITVPGDYLTIQEAINAASPGDTIFVRAGTYYENVVVNKSVSLIGEKRETTIIDGRRSGSVIKITASNVALCGFTIRNSGSRWHNAGVYVYESSNNHIFENKVIDNKWCGIYLRYASNNTLSENLISNNTYNLGINGCSLQHFIHSIATSNLVNGKPVYYLVSQKHVIINPSTHPEVGFLALINCTDITVENLTLTNNFPGLLLAYTNSSLIIGNNVTKNANGVWLRSSFNNSFCRNTVANNSNFGFVLEWSPENLLEDNVIIGNEYNFGVDGYELSHFIQDVKTSNTINGKAVYYLINESNLIINPSTHPDLGYLALVNSYNITIEGFELKNNGEGLLLANTTNSQIKINEMANNVRGIVLYWSTCNTISGNNITNNNYPGIEIYCSSDNHFYHNNILNNSEQVWRVDQRSTNVWDNGYPSGGNYWSNYTGIDLFCGSYQNATSSDGIGDMPYVIDDCNRDDYPLMGPFNTFDAGVWNEVAYNFDIISNSTVSDFHFNPEEGAFIRFNVTGENGTVGFCKVTIPKQLLWAEGGQWNVLVNGQSVNYTIISTSDENYTYLYFTYNHSTKTVIIQGTSVIPEFPSTTILPLLILTTLTATILLKKKRKPKPQLP